MVVRAKPSQWPAWYYGPNKGDEAVFQTLGDVPAGWQRKRPAEWKPTPPLQVDRDKVVAELKKRNIEIDPRWGAAHLKKVLDDCSPSR